MPRFDPTLHEQFPATRWSLVLEAQRDDPERARAGMAEICRTYWPPLYAFIRRSGFGREDAEDLVQEFLSRVIEKDLLETVAREKGRLRTWLLALLKPFLADRRRYEGATKRGGRTHVISIDADEADRRYLEDAIETLTPEDDFERRWALSVLASALDRLAREYAEQGRHEWFEALCPHLQWQGDSDGTHAESAARLGVSPGSFKVAVFRLRKRYRESLLLEVADTLGPGEDVDTEIRYLFAVLGG